MMSFRNMKAANFDLVLQLPKIQLVPGTNYSTYAVS